MVEEWKRAAEVSREFSFKHSSTRVAASKGLNSICSSFTKTYRENVCPYVGLIPRALITSA